MQLDFKEGKEHISKAILVGIVTRENSADEVEKELDELARLLDTAGGEEFARLVQNKETPDPRTVIGSGKIAELSGGKLTPDFIELRFDAEKKG